MSMYPMYVAIAEHTVQVGPDTWSTFKESLPLNGTETIDMVMDWAARRASKADNVTLTTVRP